MTIKEMNEETQNKATNKGWTAMQTLLDREMPTGKKRRRAAIGWWFVLLLVPIAVIYSWHFGAGARLDKAPAEQPKSAPGIPFATGKPSDSGTNTTNVPIVPLEQNNRLSVQNMESSDQKLQSGQSGRIGVEATPAFRSANKPSQMVNQAISHAIDQEDAKDFRSAPIETGAKTVASSAKSERLDALDVITITPQVVGSQWSHTECTPFTVTPLPVENTLIRKADDHRWSFGGNALVGTESFKSINSAGIGTAVQWQASRRWGIRSGLSYRYHSPSVGSQPAATIRSGQYEQAIVNGYEVTDLSGNVVSTPTIVFSQQQPIIIPVTKLILAEAPVLAFLKITSHLSLFTGLNAGYVMATKTKSESFSGDFTLKVNSNVAAQNLNDLAIDDIQRWRVDVQTGIGAMLGRKMELSAFIRFPLQNLSPVQTTLENSNGYFLNYNDAKGQKPRSPSVVLQATYFFKN